MITDHVPYPPSSGTSIRNYNLLRRIACEHEVWIATLSEEDKDNEGIAHLLEFCKGVEFVKTNQHRALERPLEALQYLALGRPIELRHYQSQELIEKIQRLVSKIRIDVVDIVDSYMGLYLDALPSKLRQRTVLTFIDVVFRKFDQISRLEPKIPRKLRTRVYSDMMRYWEPYYADRFRRCITVSEADRQLLKHFNPRLEIDVIPNGIDTNQYQILSYSQIRPTLLFVGNMGYRPNIDAMLYFHCNVYPLIKQEVPEVELIITGLNPPPEIQGLASADVLVTGSVADVRPFYKKSNVCIVPLRAGGGTRLKILEAMALGRPVVSTSIGCEGLDVENNKNILIADGPEKFAEDTLRLLQDEELKQYVVRQARDLVVNRYDWDVITQQLMKIYFEVTQ